MSVAIIGLIILSACPDARDARWSGDAAEARARAQACLERAPHDVEAMLELSRALALDGDYERATAWADRALETAPDAIDPRVWRARLAFWSGDLERARVTLAPTLESLDAAEAWELAGRIAMADGDLFRAETMFTTSLNLAASDPARLGRASARTRAGRRHDAFSDLDVVCKQGRCTDHERWWRTLAPVRVSAETQLLAGLRTGGVQTDTTVAATFGAPMGLRLGPVVAARTRTELDPDVAVGAQLSQTLGSRLEARADLRFGVANTTMPSLDLRGSLVVNGLGPLWLDLGGRYLDFDTDSAGIIQPSVCGDAGRWGGCARYWAVIPSEDEVRHFGMAQGWVTLWRPLLARFGAGGGTTNDFMIARGVEAAWSALAYGGVEWLFSRQHGVTATYTFRHEDQTGFQEPLDLHQVTLGYELRLAW